MQKEKTPARIMKKYVLGLCEVILHPLDFLMICAFEMATSQKIRPSTARCHRSSCATPFSAVAPQTPVADTDGPAETLKSWI